jgi:hypothetical protein
MISRPFEPLYPLKEYFSNDIFLNLIENRNRQSFEILSVDDVKSLDNFVEISKQDEIIWSSVWARGLGTIGRAFVVLRNSNVYFE